MTWTTVPNLASGDVISETYVDNVRENINHLGAMKIGNTALSALTAISATRGAVGTYTGNGSATKAITGVGFQPDFLLVWQEKTSTTGTPYRTPVALRSTNDAESMLFANGAAGASYEPAYMTDAIVSLDADGFTAGDITGAAIAYSLNANLEIYNFLALKA